MDTFFLLFLKQWDWDNTKQHSLLLTPFRVKGGCVGFHVNFWKKIGNLRCTLFGRLVR